MKLILPKTLVNGTQITGPLVFIAGPIKGGGDWQEKACDLLAKSIPNAHIAVPCRWGPNHRLYQYKLDSDQNDGFPRQSTWEHYYLKWCCDLNRRKRGCAVLYLPCESKTTPRTDGQPYARDTYGEIARWSMYAALTGGRIFVGAEEGFPGLSVIIENLRLDVRAAEFPIYPTLEKTITTASDFLNGAH